MNEFTALVFLLLMPGILGILILDSLVEHRPWPPFLYTIYAIVFGISVYITEQLGLWAWQWFVALLYWETPSFSLLSAWNNINGSGAKFEPVEIIFGVLISIPLAGFLSFIVDNKLVHRIAQRLHISNKYGDENLFSYYLNIEDISWVNIRDIQNNLTYQGQIGWFSENAKIQEIVLHNVTVYTYADAKRLYELPSVYLSRPQGCFIIEEMSEFI
ncbi:MAG: hypothetical protein ACR2PR_03090 [Pseudohongiellaceae bacterium]